MPGFFEFPNPIIEKDSHISFSKIGELILRFELKNHSLYKNFPALVFRIRVQGLSQEFEIEGATYYIE